MAKNRVETVDNFRLLPRKTNSGAGYGFMEKYWPWKQKTWYL